MIKLQTLVFRTDLVPRSNVFEVAPRCCLVVSAASQDLKKTSFKDKVVAIASASEL